MIAPRIADTHFGYSRFCCYRGSGVEYIALATKIDSLRQTNSLRGSINTQEMKTILYLACGHTVHGCDSETEAKTLGFKVGLRPAAMSYFEV